MNLCKRCSKELVVGKRVKGFCINCNITLRKNPDAKLHPRQKWTNSYDELWGILAVTNKDNYKVQIYVDTVDIPRIKTYKWFYDYTTKLAYTIINSKRIDLHKFLTNTTKKDTVDHIDGNKHNNRQVNLRICTQTENRRNNKMYTTNKTGYVGVHEYKPLKDGSLRWRARIQNKHIGTFASPEDAAIARDKVARSLFGNYTRYNFPVNGERKCQ